MVEFLNLIWPLILNKFIFPDIQIILLDTKFQLFSFDILKILLHCLFIVSIFTEKHVSVILIIYSLHSSFVFVYFFFNLTVVFSCEFFLIYTVRYANYLSINPYIFHCNYVFNIQYVPEYLYISLILKFVLHVNEYNYFYSLYLFTVCLYFLITGAQYFTILRAGEKWKWSRSVMSDSLWPNGL